MQCACEGKPSAEVRLPIRSVILGANVYAMGTIVNFQFPLVERGVTNERLTVISFLPYQLAYVYAATVVVIRVVRFALVGESGRELCQHDRKDGS